MSTPLRTAARRCLNSTPLRSSALPRAFFSSSSSNQASKLFHVRHKTRQHTYAYVVAAGIFGAGTAFTLSQLEPPEQSESPSTALNPNVTPAELDAELKATSSLSTDSPMRLRVEALIRAKQAEIVAALEEVDGSKFRWDSWDRPNNGGGGTSCVLQNGNVFEKAGVNISVVYGPLHPRAVAAMRAEHKSLGAETENLSFFAAGLSMVLHPSNPNAPTVHLNYRYFETMKPDGTTNSWWFGGGTDLTPSYLFEEDAVHFHKTLKEACDKHDPAYYPRFKKWCDEYFYIKHRNETRGIGGIFFDDLNDRNPDELLSFIGSGLDAFLPAYIPIIEKRKNLPFTPEQKEWQQVRRGRYVEFNLVYDRGTAFGLNTPGSRIESILMSLPVSAQWYYMHSPEPGSEEDKLLKVLQKPIEWV